MSIGDTFPYPNLINGQTNWGPDLVKILDELITRVSSPVPLSALSGSGLDMDGGPITNIDYLELQNNTVAPTANPGGVYYLNGEWYLITDAGAIQVTDGGGLNTTINGGIAGDYGGTNPASVRFVDATQRYDFYDDFAGGAWGYLRARGFDIAAGATSSIRARLAFTGAANLTFTFPADLPASNRSIVTIDSAGLMSHNSSSTKISNDIYLDTTTVIKHGDRQVVSLVRPGCLVAAGSIVTDPVRVLTSSANTAIYFSIPTLQTGWRIKSIKLTVNKAGINNTVLKLYASAFDSALVELASTTSSGTSGDVTITATLGTPTTVLDGANFVGYVSSVDSGDKYFTTSIVYDVV